MPENEPEQVVAEWVSAEENQNRDYDAAWYGAVIGGQIAWDLGQTPTPPTPPPPPPLGPPPVPAVGNPPPVKAPKPRLPSNWD